MTGSGGESLRKNSKACSGVDGWGSLIIHRSKQITMATLMFRESPRDFDLCLKGAEKGRFARLEGLGHI